MKDTELRQSELVRFAVRVALAGLVIGFILGMVAALAGII